MPRLLLDTYPEYRLPLIFDESETGAKAPTQTQETVIFWEGEWSEEAFRFYQFRYGPTPIKYRITFYGGTNTDCRSIIAQSFQEPIWERLDRILDEFEVADYKATLKFIAKYPNITPLLKYVRRAIRRYFGNADVSLVPKIDPEIGTQEMWVYVQTDMPVPEAMKKLKVFDREFFGNIWERTDQRLCFDLKFK